MPPLFSVIRLFITATSTAVALSATPIEGPWTGTVAAPQGEEPIGLEISRNSKGRLVAVMHMPVMHVDGLRIGLSDDGDGVYSIPPLDTTMRLEGDTLTGTFALGKLPMTLSRGGTIPGALPASDVPEGPPAVWKLALGASVWASPVSRDGVVYVGSTDGVMHAVRAEDGEPLWRWIGPTPLYGEAVPTGDSLLVVDARCSLVCLDRATGALRWRVDLHDEAAASGPAPTNPAYNNRTPVPLLAEGVLYVGSTDGGLYAIDESTGAKLWRAPAGAAVFGTPAVFNGELIVGCYDGSVVAFSIRDGAEIRRMKLPGPVVSTPVVANDVVVIGCRNYMLYGINAANFAPAWRSSYWFSWVESTPRLDGGLVYVGSSDYRRVSAIEAATGKTRWAADVGGLTWGSPVIAGDMIFAGAASQRDAILPHIGGLVAIDRATGSVKWRHPISLVEGHDRAGFIGSLTLSGDLVIGATVDGMLLAFPAS